MENINKLNKDFLQECIYGNSSLKKIKHLLNSGADIHVNNDQAFLNAIRSGNMEVVQYLKESGSNIHTQDNLALQYAIGGFNVKIVKYLLDNGVPIGAQNDKAVLLSAITGDIKMLEYLKEKGAKIVESSYLMDNIMLSKKMNVIKYLILDHGFCPKNTIENAKKNDFFEIISWCEKYIESEILKNKLEQDLSVINNYSKRIKV